MRGWRWVKEGVVGTEEVFEEDGRMVEDGRVVEDGREEEEGLLRGSLERFRRNVRAGVVLVEEVEEVAGEEEEGRLLILVEVEGFEDVNGREKRESDEREGVEEEDDGEMVEVVEGS